MAYTTVKDEAIKSNGRETGAWATSHYHGQPVVEAANSGGCHNLPVVVATVVAAPFPPDYSFFFATFQVPCDFVHSVL